MRACGPHQYAVGRQAGGEKVHKAATAMTAASPADLALTFDATNAFNTMPRQRILAGVAARMPD
eukprot:9119271-Pyramimonas_sp.AAC.1